jgi:hypothetical protein
MEKLETQINTLKGKLTSSRTEWGAYGHVLSMNEVRIPKNILIMNVKKTPNKEIEIKMETTGLERCHTDEDLTRNSEEGRGKLWEGRDGQPWSSDNLLKVEKS